MFREASRMTDHNYKPRLYTYRRRSNSLQLMMLVSLRWNVELLVSGSGTIVKHGLVITIMGTFESVPLCDNYMYISIPIQSFFEFSQSTKSQPQSGFMYETLCTRTFYTEQWSFILPA
jgi:hypothetical protein